jgi:DNA-binding NarL/FixJ family response regulator
MSSDGSAVGSELRVLVVSNMEITRAGIAAVLRPFRGRVKVVGEANQIDGAFPDESSSDVVLFDAHLGLGDGLAEVARLTEGWDDHRIVVLANPGEGRFMGPVIQRGAAGFLFLSIGGAELADDLEQVSVGTIVVDSTLAGGHPSLAVGSAPGDSEMNSLPWPGSHLGLTETESQVLELLALGERTTSIGRRLEIDPLEVKRHLRSAYRRLDVRDRSRALARLAQEGLFS